MQLRTFPVLLVLALAPVAQAQIAATPAPAQAPAAPKLQIGDAAPALAVEQFVKGTPVAELPKGKAHVLLFWAPWNHASVDQLVEMSAVQKEYAEVGLVVLAIASTDVTGTTLDKVKESLKERGDAVTIPVAWDKGTATKDAFLKAAGRSQLPSVVLVDPQGRVVYVESALLVRQFLDPLAAGTLDVTTMANWHHKAARATKTEADLLTAARSSKWAEVLAFSSELLEVDPVGKGGHAQSRMLAQAKLGSPEKAIEWAKAWVDGAGRTSSEGLNAVAWTIVDPADPFPKSDLELAMKAVVRSAELTKHEDGAILDTLARVHFRKGDVAKAVEVQKKALEKLKPAQEQFRGQLQDALKEYEAALAQK
jgi:tetratricopeptide (TPR) repeat protein